MLDECYAKLKKHVSKSKTNISSDHHTSHLHVQELIKPRKEKLSSTLHIQSAYKVTF